MRRSSDAVPVESLRVSAYRIPTDVSCESDGTFEWTATTLVLVEAQAGGVHALGYTYADTATAALIRDLLAGVVCGRNVMANGAIWAALVASIRNLGRSGVTSMAISAVDIALWDLKARLLEVPLITLLGAVRHAVPVYGSGGFTSYSTVQLERQLAAWVGDGITRVKMKVGRDPDADVRRVGAARNAIGPDVELFVDANGAYSPRLAMLQAERFSESRVTWFEEPVYHRDLGGMRFCREHAPAGMDISVGEYGYAPTDFARILEAGAVDVLQADASRCEGITGLMVVDGLCEANTTPLSTHCAPAVHAQVACAAKRVRHVEYFHDHARIERLLFDGALGPVDGVLRPDPSRPGLGLEFKHADAAAYAV